MIVIITKGEILILTLIYPTHFMDIYTELVVMLLATVSVAQSVKYWTIFAGSLGGIAPPKAFRSIFPQLVLLWS